MNVNLTDREAQVCTAALHELIAIKSGSFKNPEAILIHFQNQKLNQFDLLASGHTLAAAVTAMEKLSGRKITDLMRDALR